MKKGFLNVAIFILSLAAIFCIFFNNSGNTSSITSNTSRGIILTSTSRVKKIEKARISLPAANPAALIEYGLGDAIEFSDATQDAALLMVRIPKDIDRTVQPNLQLEWSSEATGDARIALTYIWIAEDETTDVTSGTTTTTTAVYTNSNIKGLIETEIQLADMSADDIYLKGKIARIADHTSDTANSAVIHIFDSYLYYTANKLGEPL